MARPDAAQRRALFFVFSADGDHNPLMRPPLYILTGGQSTRFGTDKATHRLPNGEIWHEHVQRSLGYADHETTLVQPQGQTLKSTTLRTIHDETGRYRPARRDLGGADRPPAAWSRRLGRADQLRSFAAGSGPDRFSDQESQTKHPRFGLCRSSTPAFPRPLSHRPNRPAQKPDCSRPVFRASASKSKTPPRKPSARIISNHTTQTPKKYF